jgi:hypothetical protein
MIKFVLELTDGDQNRLVYFDVLKTSIADKWAAEVFKNYDLFEIDRFSNWPNSGITDSTFIDKLNSLIDTINNYKSNTITARLDYNVDQEYLNALHKFFETLRGPVEQGTDWYNLAPRHIQEAVCNFNIIIHEYEHFKFNQTANTGHPYATIVGTYKNRPRFNLTQDDHKHFTFKWQFGTVYINYCEVGKPLLDVFKDNDTIVGDNNVRPLEYYSADFQIKFGPSTPDEIYVKRQQDFNQWLEKQTYNFKNLSLGLIPVASLNITDSGFENLQPVDIVNALSGFQRIRSTRIEYVDELQTV